MEFLCDNYIKITEMCFHETKNNEMHHKIQCDTDTFVYDVTSQM